MKSMCPLLALVVVAGCAGSEPVLPRGVYEIELAGTSGPAADALRVSTPRLGEIEVDADTDTVTFWVPTRTETTHTAEHHYQATGWERRALVVDGDGTTRMEAGCVVRDRAELIRQSEEAFTVKIRTQVVSACPAGQATSGTRTLRHRLLSPCASPCGFSPEGDACVCGEG